MSKKDEKLAAIAAMSDIIKAHLTVGDDGEIVGPADLVTKVLPENLTVEDLNAADDFKSRYVAAAYSAVGQIGIEAMKQNPNIDKVSYHGPINGKAVLSVEGDRSVSRPPPGSPAGTDPVTTWGAFSFHLEQPGFSGSNSVMKEIRKNLSSMAAEAFGK